MNRIVKKVVPFSLLAPYFCAFTPSPLDESELSAAIAAGGGSYAEVSRDCNGNVQSVKEHPYREYAASLRYHKSGLELGVAGGRSNGFHRTTSYQLDPNGRLVESPKEPVVYLTPSIGFNSKYVGLELGCLASLNNQPVGIEHPDGLKMPSGMLRLGRSDKTHFSASLARNLPLFSGGGLIDAGFGFPVGSNGSQFWMGLGAYPYDGLVFSFKGDVKLSDHFAFTPTLHAKGGVACEYGYGIGGRVTF